MREQPYQREAALAYARQWALNRNPAYHDFEQLGGDCTNFASQCLLAGAGVMNFTPVIGWYYRSLSDRSAAWTGVEFLYRFLLANRSIGPYAREVAQSEARPGDIVQLGARDGRFYHSPVVTALHPTLLVAAHSDDALDRTLSSYAYARLRFLHIQGVRAW